MFCADLLLYPPDILCFDWQYINIYIIMTFTLSGSTW